MSTPRPEASQLFERLSFARLFFLALALVALNLSLQLSLDEALDSELWAALLASILVFVGMPFLLARLLGDHPLRSFRLHLPRPKSFALVTLITVASVFPIDLLTTLNSRLLSVPPEVLENMRQLKPDSVPSWAMAVCALCVVAPLGEEIVFRGLLQQAALLRMGTVQAIAMCAILFAAVHLQPYYLVGLISVGVLLGVIFLRTGNLSASIYAHGLYNLISLVTLSPKNTNAETSLTTGVLGWSLAAAGLLICWWALKRLSPDGFEDPTWTIERSVDQD
jgi:membrane protease YdiL (CAAX protease family)